MAISPSTSKPQHARNADGHGNVGLAGLMVGAVGVVFGDIGTSPLYTIKQAFSPHYGLIANHDTVLGLLSLVFWSLMMVVTVKYVTIIMRADNEGEGGIMADRKSVVWGQRVSVREDIGERRIFKKKNKK